jgi:hypothetical protein
MIKIKCSPGMQWAVLRAMEIIDTEPNSLEMSPEETGELARIMLDANFFCTSGYVTIRNMSSDRYKLLAKLFDVLSVKASSLFKSDLMQKKMRASATACRRKFHEMYVKKYMTE